MTKVEINGKTYCVETLIYEVERLTKDVKASAKYHKLVLDKIREDIFDEIKNRYTEVRDKSMTQWCRGKVSGLKRTLEIIDKYR